MTERDHSKIIAKAARTALTPLGFRRRGQSRVWLADRGFWLSVVEFQPSGFSKGSYLNVAAHWHWHPLPHLSFDYMLPGRTRPFIEFVDEVQFEPLAREQAEQAARESQQLADKLSSITGVALTLEHDPVLDRGGWPTLHAAVAAGLVGNTSTANSLFSSLDSQVVRMAGGWIAGAQQSMSLGEFPAYVRNAVNEGRARFGLPAWSGEF